MSTYLPGAPHWCASDVSTHLLVALQYDYAPHWCGREVSECLLRYAPHWCASVLAMHQVGARGCCFEATPLKRIPVLAAGRVPYQAQALTNPPTFPCFSIIFYFL